MIRAAPGHRQRVRLVRTQARPAISQEARDHRLHLLFRSRAVAHRRQFDRSWSELVQSRVLQLSRQQEHSPHLSEHERGAWRVGHEAFLDRDMLGTVQLDDLPDRGKRRGQTLRNRIGRAQSDRSAREPAPPGSFALQNAISEEAASGIDPENSHDVSLVARVVRNPFRKWSTG